MNVVRIGYIASSLTDLELSKPLIEQIIQPDLDEYAGKLGYNVTFQFEIVDALSQGGVHLQKLQELKAMGIDLVISGGWSSMLSDGMSYANNNHMLLVGTSSTSPWGLATPNDRLFRMLPPESAISISLAGIMWSYGVKSVIVIQRGDSWGNGFVDAFEPVWIAKGGELAGDPIKYLVDETDFSGYLEAANFQAQAAKAKYPEGDRVAILLLAFDEDETIVSQIKDYAPLYDCVMFGGRSHVGLKMDGFIGNPDAIHLKTFTPSPQPFKSSIHDELTSRYSIHVNYLDDQGAYLYDAAWAIAASVLETRSTDASVVAHVFSDVCGRYYGASGWCRLDKNGDRAPLPYDVWFYGQDSSYAKPRSLAGVYVPDTDTMTWNIGELGFAPNGP
jgi:branched-chain amino acid transport system substrate-binding protein